MTLIEQINQGMKEAMRAKDQLRLETLRMLKSKILAADARANLPDTEVVKLFKTYFGNLEEALEHAHTAKRQEMIEKLKAEMAIVQEFLPKPLSAEETKRIVMQAISDSGAKSKKEFGLVMKSIMKTGAHVDGKLAKELVFQVLPD